jgi:hypothetical protein
MLYMQAQFMLSQIISWTSHCILHKHHTPWWGFTLNRSNAAFMNARTRRKWDDFDKFMWIVLIWVGNGSSFIPLERTWYVIQYHDPGPALYSNNCHGVPVYHLFVYILCYMVEWFARLYVWTKLSFLLSYCFDSWLFCSRALAFIVKTPLCT